MKAPTLEEFKARYQNAKIVRSTYGVEFDYTESKNMRVEHDCIYVTAPDGECRSMYYHSRYSPEYAEIVSFKDMDYTTKGTALPNIPEGVNYRCSNWDNGFPDCIYLNPKENHISYGVRVFKDSIYILHERKDYDGNNYFMTKLSDIQTLANQQQVTNNQKQEQKMRTIKYNQAQQIIDIACNMWQDDLSALWAKEIVLKRDIQITDEFYQKMRKACTSPQNELFDKIFGKDNQFKIGDWIMFEGSYKAGPYKLATVSGRGFCDQDGNYRDTNSEYYRLATAKEIAETMYKVGDWVIDKKGEYPAKQVEKINDTSLSLLNDIGTYTFDYCRLATEEEILKVKVNVKIGDWIVPLTPKPAHVGHARGNRAYEIYFVDGRGVRTYDDCREKDGNGYIQFNEFRLATQEEIKQAQIIPQGTPCLVRDTDSQPWYFAYSNGDGTYHWQATSNSVWAQVQRLNVKDLPKYK